MNDARSDAASRTSVAVTSTTSSTPFTPYRIPWRNCPGAESQQQADPDGRDAVASASPTSPGEMRVCTGPCGATSYSIRMPSTITRWPAIATISAD